MVPILYFVYKLIEKAVEVTVNLYLPFGSVKHEKMIKLLEQLNIDGMNLRIKKHIKAANSGYKK